MTALKKIELPITPASLFLKGEMRGRSTTNWSGIWAGWLGLGHADRRVGLMDACRELMRPIKRKSIEPLAAHLDPACASETLIPALLRCPVGVVG